MSTVNKLTYAHDKNMTPLLQEELVINKEMNTQIGKQAVMNRQLIKEIIETTNKHGKTFSA